MNLIWSNTLISLGKWMRMMVLLWLTINRNEICIVLVFVYTNTHRERERERKSCTVNFLFSFYLFDVFFLLQINKIIHANIFTINLYIKLRDRSINQLFQSFFSDLFDFYLKKNMAHQRNWRKKIICPLL